MKKSSSNFTQRQRLKKQKGAALIVSLFLLLVLTIIGVNSAQSTSLEEKMAHGILDRNVAMQSAE
ncbi:MAG: pilus assembly protein PilX, partial [Gammaproteobacteria bacterium]|nr:pilus assembly protein PilX [Gammaproteobacteria bacterium]